MFDLCFGLHMFKSVTVLPELEELKAYPHQTRMSDAPQRDAIQLYHLYLHWKRILDDDQVNMSDEFFTKML